MGCNPKNEGFGFPWIWWSTSWRCRQALKMLLNTSSFAQAALHAGGAVASDPKKESGGIAMIKWVFPKIVVPPNHPFL